MSRLEAIRARRHAYLAVRMHRDELIESGMTPDAYDLFDHTPDDLAYLLRLVEAADHAIHAARTRRDCWTRETLGALDDALATYTTAREEA